MSRSLTAYETETLWCLALLQGVSSTDVWLSVLEKLREMKKDPERALAFAGRSSTPGDRESTSGSLPGFTVRHKEDGCWLEFRDSRGCSAAINLSAYAQDRGPVVRKVITQWIEDLRLGSAQESGNGPGVAAEVPRAPVFEVPPAPEYVALGAHRADGAVSASTSPEMASPSGGKPASQLLLESAGPFDEACTKVRELEREVTELRRQNAVFALGILSIQRLVNSSLGVWLLDNSSVYWSDLRWGGKSEVRINDFLQALGELPKDSGRAAG